MIPNMQKDIKNGGMFRVNPIDVQAGEHRRRRSINLLLQRISGSSGTTRWFICTGDI
jgi:hypothetical protein